LTHPASHDMLRQKCTEQGVEDYHFFQVFPTCEDCFKQSHARGRGMAVFMGKRSIETRNGHLWSGAGLPAFTRRLPYSQGPFPHHQFLGHQIRYFLTEPVQLANEYSVYSARTAPTLVFACPCVSRRKSGQRDKKTWGTTLSKKGGDAIMD